VGDDMMWFLLALLVAAVPFVLPIVSLVRQARLQRRTTELEERLEAQQDTLLELRRAVDQLRSAPSRATARAERSEGPAAALAPTAPRPAAPDLAPHPASAALPPQPAASRPVVERSSPPAAEARRPAPPPEPTAVRGKLDAFDWESLVGVKLFSIVAGVALVLAAVFFLRYSLEHGWLAPRVRMAIGVLVAVSLLVGCELKAARQYRITANALDAAAIAILFATLYAGYALWGLVPSSVAFGLLALVTALAVLLSIRRDSLFIALLGLLGGFSTPALLSTGENQPVPLFVYLLVLNLGLAVVAYRKRWPQLTALTLVLTSVYQWGWVLTFLSVSQLPLAMGIFAVFSITLFGALAFGRRVGGTEGARLALDRAGIVAAAMPLAFAAFLAAVPRYGAQTGLLFGFLLIIVLGLLAAALGRRDERLHAVGAGATLLVFAVWIATSYASTGWRTALFFAAAFAVVHALAPLLAARLGRPFRGLGSRAAYAAPLVLGVVPAMIRIEPATASPWLPVGVVLATAVLIAWRAVASGDGALSILAAFAVIATEGVWTAGHFSGDQTQTGAALYAACAAFVMTVPVLWRRRWGQATPNVLTGAFVWASLAMLWWLADGVSEAPRIWGLALLLAIIAAQAFVESAATGLRMLTTAGVAASWVALAAWWSVAAGAVGTLPAQLMMVAVVLAMCALYSRQAGGSERTRPTLVRDGAEAEGSQPSAGQSGRGAPAGLDADRVVYFGVLGQVFLAFIASRSIWATPPGPLLGSLTVVTLATSAASLAAGIGSLHAAGVAASALVLAVFASEAQGDWWRTSIVAGELLVAYAATTLTLWRRGRAAAAVGAAVTLFVASQTVTSASGSGGAPVAVAAAAHVVNTALILALAWRRQWTWVAPAAVVPAWIASLAWMSTHSTPDEWRGALVLASALYAVFLAYPIVLRGRTRDTRDPYITAIAASVFFFFVGRAALTLGDLEGVVGVIPVVEGLALAFLVRQLLQLQPVGTRDFGRLALVAGASLAFATVAIPLQLDRQWITIGWALEGAALAWLYARVPHKGLLAATAALFAAVFVRLAANPSVFAYEPRGPRILNWYLYAYLTSAAACFVAAWWLSSTDDRWPDRQLRLSALLNAAGTILLFLLLNVEIADFYATGPDIAFRFGVTLGQDLTYTIGWLVFGLVLLVAGITLSNRGARGTAVALIGITAFKAFLYDMGSLGGLYRVGSLVGLAVSLSLVAVALQKFVLRTRETS
jgi:uncharacterized membrane protein